MSEDHRAGLLPSPPERDSTLAFLREGYDFISNRCNALGSDAFATRLMLRPVTCLRGAEAATMFYAPGRMSRRGAMPRSVVRLLQDHGSVQALDGAAHRQRRALFLGAMTPERQGAARAFHAQELAAALDGPIPSPVRFDRLIEHVFCCTALRWSGIPCSQRSIYRRTQELVAMFASAGRVGPARLRAACLRERSERWARKEIAMARAEPAASGWLVDALIAHRDTDGAALDDCSAAVELRNVLRPIVAVSRFATYALHAMAVHPEAIEWLWSRGDEDAARAFGDEVRRLYPFFPVIGGTVRTPFTWRRQKRDDPAGRRRHGYRPPLPRRATDAGAADRNSGLFIRCRADAAGPGSEPAAQPLPATAA